MFFYEVVNIKTEKYAWLMLNESGNNSLNFIADREKEIKF